MSKMEGLFEEARKLPEVPGKILEMLKEKEQALAAEWIEGFCGNDFCKKVFSVGHIGALSAEPYEHLRLVRFCLSAKKFEFFIKYIAWEYRVCKNRGIENDYFLWALSRWRDIISNILGGDAFSLVELYKWLISRHNDLVEIAESKGVLLYGPSVGWEEPQKSFLTYILRGDVVRCLELARSLVSTPVDYQRFCSYVIQPVMYHIGRMWENGLITSAQEHMATAIVNRVMFTLYAPYAAERSVKNKALITSVLNEHHEVGARMVADFMEIEGWDVYYLGTSAPQDEVVTLARDLRPDVVGLYVVMPSNLENARELIAKLRATRIGCSILIGGPLAKVMPEMFLATGADACCKNAEEALSWAREFVKRKRKIRYDK